MDSVGLTLLLDVSIMLDPHSDSKLELLELKSKALARRWWSFTVSLVTLAKNWYGICLSPDPYSSYRGVATPDSGSYPNQL